jgi:hypothetical protein
MPAAETPSIRNWPGRLAEDIAAYFRDEFGCTADVSLHPVGMHNEMALVKLRTEQASAVVRIAARSQSPRSLEIHLPLRASIGDPKVALTWSEKFLDAHPVGTPLAGGEIGHILVQEPGMTKARIVATVHAGKPP